MIKEFENIIASKELRIKLQKALDVVFAKNFPVFWYFGVNYDQSGIRSIKFYIVSFKKTDVERLRTFFPYTDEIRDVYKDFESSMVFDMNNLGAAFGIKVDKSFDISYSFYQKKHGYIPPPPQSFHMLSKEKSIREDYYVMEFKKDKGYIKNYYLLFNNDNITSIIMKFDLNNALSVSDLGCVELGEFQNKQKISLTFKDDLKKEQYIKDTNNHSFLELDQFIKNTYGFFSFFPGNYLGNNLKSIYYFDRNVSNDFFQNSYTLYRLLQIKKPLEKNVK